MSEEENNQPQEYQESEPNESTIPDIDTSTYQERDLNTDDLIEK
jgi:hypothetical protein